MRSTALSAAAILVLLAGCARSPVVLPPASASPAIVLDAYLDALQSGDCRVARALATAGFADQSDAFCSGVRVTAYSVFPDPSIVNGNYVEFTLSLTTSGRDETLLAGSHTWFYALTRQTGGAWRVDGGGDGP